MTIIKALILAALLSGSWITESRAANLESLIAASDVVVIGTVSPQGSAVGTTILLSVTPERVLKGAATAGTPINVQWASQAASVGGPIQQSSVFTLPTAWRGIWFLGRSGDGVLTPIPIRLGNQASLVDLFYKLSTSQLPEALSSALSGTSSLVDQLALEIANAAGAEGKSDFPGNLVAATRDLDSSAIRQAFTWLAGQPQSRAKATGLAGLITRGDVNGLLAFEQATSVLDPPDLALPLRELRVSFRNPESAGIACLTRLASGSGGYRDALGDAAVHVLGAIHSAETLPALVAALDSPRPERRRRAVVGLGSFANSLPIQSPANMASLGFMRMSGPAPFRTPETLQYMTVPVDADDGTEAAFVQFWKTWWIQAKTQLGF